VEAKVPESTGHFEVRTALYQLLSFFLRGRACVGSHQFVYFDASDPKACLAPDVYLKLGVLQEDIQSWKTWERGSLDLAIEIASRSDAPEELWERKVTRYHQLGARQAAAARVRELQAEINRCAAARAKLLGCFKEYATIVP
jgi:hypothetical protein